MNIECKPIKDYEDLYLVSNTGLVKSLHWGKEKLLKQVIRKIKETLNDEVKFNYVQEKVDAYGVRTVQKTIKSFVLKEKIEEILKEVEQ